MSNPTALVQKLWNYCNILRDDGLSYGDYVEQLTFLLFLKMADEQSRPPFNKPSPIPKGKDWPALLAKDGDELEIHYRHTLEELGKRSGMLGVIFRKAQNKIQDPAKLRRLIVDLIDKEQWSSLSADVKGDAYEGLLQKNAEDVKGGAGQYFTPRPLIAAIVDAIQPTPGNTICDPACGTGGFLLAAHDYIAKHYTLDRAQKQRLKNGTLFGIELVDSVTRLCAMNLLLHGIGGNDAVGSPSLPQEERAGERRPLNAPANLEVRYSTPATDALALNDRPGLSRRSSAKAEGEGASGHPRPSDGRGAGGEGLPVITKDALAGKHGEYEIVLANPPFGKKSSVTIVNEAGESSKESLIINRDDFWASTSNKQLNFLQHIFTILKQHGRAAVVLPDNVLFEGGAGETIRRALLKQADVHTLLRLPTGIFYAQGVKANVLFFDRKPAQEKPWTQKLWIYDLRTNLHFTLKENTLKRTDLDDFVNCYFGQVSLSSTGGEGQGEEASASRRPARHSTPDTRSLSAGGPHNAERSSLVGQQTGGGLGKPLGRGEEAPASKRSLRPSTPDTRPRSRHSRIETDRFKSFTYEELTKRDKVNLDIFWLKDEALEDSANLPAPEVIAADITADLEAALEQFATIAEDLKK